MTELVKRSATWMARAVREREVSAVELLDAHLERIDARNPEINAIVVPRYELARSEAVAADAAVARGDSVGPMHGVPVTIKETIPLAGFPATNGSLLLSDYVPGEDAGVVRRLRAAGAIVIGKTNLPEFSMLWDSVCHVYGATRNPHDHTRTAGGSSGGESAAIASAMSPFGIGSDLTGSIRAPAAWTGIFGLRAGRDAIPTAEHRPLPAGAGIQMWGTVGPMARYAEDIDLGLDVVADPRAAAEIPVRVAAFEDDGMQPVSEACRVALRRAAGALRDGGLEVVEARPPRPAELRAAFDTALGMEMIATLPGVVGDRLDELMPYTREMAEAMAGATPDFTAHLRAFETIASVEADALAWFEQFPVALCPVVPDVAPPLGVFSFPPVDGVEMNPGGKLTLCSYANALGLPALAVPVMLSPDGLPVGVQLIGRRGQERTLVALARRLEEALGGWLDPDQGGGGTGA
jgi:Asp-tRNA(Asn)/Glu-tRNA(Gln) amidotransferase A subunit family amidase